MKLMRVLEYEGTPEKLKKQMDMNGVKRYHGNPFTSNENHVSIRELVLGKDTPIGQRIKLAWRIVMGTYEDPEVVL